jgi:hypothetical protein
MKKTKKLDEVQQQHTTQHGLIANLGSLGHFDWSEARTQWRNLSP